MNLISRSHTQLRANYIIMYNSQPTLETIFFVALHSLQCVPGDEVDVLQPSLGHSVPVLINLLHDSAQVHGVLDDVIVVWNLRKID